MVGHSWFLAGSELRKVSTQKPYEFGSFGENLEKFRENARFELWRAFARVKVRSSPKRAAKTRRTKMFNANVINPNRSRGGESLAGRGAGAGGADASDMGFIEAHIELQTETFGLDGATADRIERSLDRQNERAAQLASERQLLASANRKARREALLERLRNQDQTGWEPIGA